MSKTEAYRNPAAEAFRMPDAPTLTARVLRKSTMAATELKYDQRNFGTTSPMAREDAYLIALHLRACHDHDLYFDGRIVRPKNYFAGVTSISDLRQEPVADIRDPFHCIVVHLPRRAIDAMTDEAGAARVGDFRHEPGVSTDDPVVRHLLASLLPALMKPEEAQPLFLDHLSLALIAHLAHTYGGMTAIARLPRGGLAPWQERRVKELMSDTLQEEVPLSRLANECGLSVRHFARAFRRSTGTSPHRWLLQRRVERAGEMLGNRAISLAGIALACGFADQSHFSRVFGAMVGASPGAWRRAIGGRPRSKDHE